MRVPVFIRENKIPTAIASVLALAVVVTLAVQSCDSRRGYDGTFGSLPKAADPMPVPVAGPVYVPAPREATWMIDTAKVSERPKAFVRAHWDALFNTCPGLADYKQDLHFAGVSDMDDPSYPSNVRGIGPQFRVEDFPQKIPRQFQAGGHLCSFRVTPDGRSVILEKDVCAEICLEHQVSSPSPSNRLVPMRAP